MNGGEVQVRERKHVGGVGFGGKKVGRELSLEQENITVASDLEAETKMLGEEQISIAAGLFSLAGRVNSPQRSGQGTSSRKPLRGWQHLQTSVQHLSLNDFFLKVAGEMQTGCQIVISSWRGDHH